MPINIQIVGLDRLQAGINRGPATIAQEARTAMDAATLTFESAARTLAPRDTGRLQGSITSRVSGSGGNLTGSVGPSVQYGIYVERGTRAHFPPPGALRGWAGRHGMNPFALARGISRKGTRAQPFLQPAFDQNVARVRALFDRIGANVVARMAG